MRGGRAGGDSRFRGRARATVEVCVAVWVAACAAAGGDDGPASAPDGYVERLGQDTMAVEHYSVAADSQIGRIVFRSPVTQEIRYAAELDERGLARSLTATMAAIGPGGPPDQWYSVSIEGDSAHVVTVTDGDTARVTHAVPGTAMAVAPRFPLSLAALQSAVDHYRSAGVDTLAVAMVNPVIPGPLPARITMVDDERVSVRIRGIEMLLTLDEAGRVTLVDATRSTMNTMTTLESGVDMEALGTAFAGRDVQGDSVGIPSPPAEARLAVGGADLTVRYSQPAMRGRQVWGGLVPFGEVWRTGANAATHLETTGDLVIGGSHLAAGIYTLWSVHGPDGAELVVNAQTGQWGTQHDASRDLFKVPLRLDLSEEPVERFTIALEPDGAAARLVLSWDGRRYSVDVRPA